MLKDNPFFGETTLTIALPGWTPYIECDLPLERQLSRSETISTSQSKSGLFNSSPASLRFFKQKSP